MRTTAAYAAGDQGVDVGPHAARVRYGRRVAAGRTSATGATRPRPNAGDLSSSVNRRITILFRERLGPVGGRGDRRQARSRHSTYPDRRRSEVHVVDHLLLILEGAQEAVEVVLLARLGEPRAEVLVKSHVQA
jgi:hypothetical protein